jgi:hypothetical protein
MRKPPPAPEVVFMVARSKWQGLPTEAINRTLPSTSSPRRHRRRDVERGSQVLAAVQREKAHRRGHRHHHAGAAGADASSSSAQAPVAASAYRSGGDAAHLRDQPDLVLAIMAGGKGAIVRPRNPKTMRRGRAVDEPPQTGQEGRRDWRLGERHRSSFAGAVEARRAGESSS